MLAKQITEYLEDLGDRPRPSSTSEELSSERRWRRFLSGSVSSDMEDMEVMGDTEGGGVRVPMEPPAGVLGLLQGP